MGRGMAFVISHCFDSSETEVTSGNIRISEEKTVRKKHSPLMHRQFVGMRVNVEDFYFLSFPKTKTHLL